MKLTEFKVRIGAVWAVNGHGCKWKVDIIWGRVG